jgi:SCP-2 sterol transfer family protein
MTTSTVDSMSGLETFLLDLAARRHEPQLRNARGTIRFDQVDGEHVQHWFVALDHGDIQVSRRHAHPDAVVRLDRSLAEGIVSGEMNTMTALLRGDLVADGDLSLLLLFQRLFPSPPR